MSKTNKTTKIATCLNFAADFGEEVALGYGTAQAVQADGGDILVQTSCGLVAWWNGFSSPSTGDRVILRKGGARSHGDMPWAMTGWA